MEDFNPTPKLKGDLIERIKKKKATETNKYRNELGGTLINNTKSVSFDVKNYEEMLNLLTEGQKFESNDYIYKILSISDKGIIKADRIKKVKNPPQMKQTFNSKTLWNYCKEGRIKFLR